MFLFCGGPQDWINLDWIQYVKLSYLWSKSQFKKKIPPVKVIYCIKQSVSKNWWVWWENGGSNGLKLHPSASSMSLFLCIYLTLYHIPYATLALSCLRLAYQLYFDRHLKWKMSIFKKTKKIQHRCMFWNYILLFVTPEETPPAVTFSPVSWERSISSVRIRLWLRCNSINRWLAA